MAPTVSPPRSPPIPDPTTTPSTHHADNDRDNDSAIFDTDSIASSTTSVSSSIMKHREENGRTYHSYKDGQYLYPNDEIFNIMFIPCVTMGNYYPVLLTKIFKFNVCLTWVRGREYGPLTMAMNILKQRQRTFPFSNFHSTNKTQVLGIDLSPIQPAFIPANVTFEVDDVEEPWTYSRKFDLIHARMVTGSLANVPKFFEQAFENTVPGGYIELSDITVPICCDDGTMKDDSAMLQWILLLLEASKKAGRDLNVSATYKEQLERVGYTDIVEKIYVWPMNKWPKDPKFKELGLWTCENLVWGVGGLSMALLTRVCGWSVEEVEAYLVNVRKEIRDTRIHSYWNIRTVYGRKPLETSR
ncbi:putative methyltransferase [Lachnellula subtilissima]|uniref:Putative methyltransferase n=1 Tax=Lachnellula subtilissima TaxID=602034 RepID=A0A8H8RI27_9HELO|nr:putative methyltransferase [Lachnellula subtilissima]